MSPHCSRSAIHNLMSACRVTPRCRAWRSSPSTTHVGKSTFTRLICTFGRFAFDQSTWPLTSSPFSNFRPPSRVASNHHFSEHRIIAIEAVVGVDLQGLEPEPEFLYVLLGRWIGERQQLIQTRLFLKS